MYLTETEGDKLKTLTLALDTMPKICGHVANGGTLIDLCKTWGVPYAHVLYWINEDGKRAEIYERSIKGGMVWAIDRVIKELKQLAMVDVSDAYDEQGALKHPKDMPEGVRRAIQSIDVFEEFEGTGKDRKFVGYTKKVKFWDKTKSLELMGKRFAMWIDRTQVNINSKSLEDLVSESQGDTGDDVIETETITTTLPSEIEGQSVAIEKDSDATNLPTDPPRGGI